LIRNFIVFENTDAGLPIKKMAGYHQFHAVNVAVEETLRAAILATDDRVIQAMGRFATRKPGGKPGDRRIGVVWPPQGSGTSLTMAF